MRLLQKNSKLVSATKTDALIAHVGPVMHICIGTVTKWCETHPIMSFRPNGADWMRSLQKTQKWFRLQKPVH